MGAPKPTETTIKRPNASGSRAARVRAKKGGHTHGEYEMAECERGCHGKGADERI